MYANAGGVKKIVWYIAICCSAVIILSSLNIFSCKRRYGISKDVWEKIYEFQNRQKYDTTKAPFTPD